MATKLSETGVVFPNLTTQTTAGVTVATGGTGISVSAANGAVTFTNSGVTSLVAGTGVSVSGATGAVTVSATGGGTVTSVGTGNGLSGGTITSSGTLEIAAPGYNTVGSYVHGAVRQLYSSTVTYTGGNSYSAGSGSQQIQAINTFNSVKTNNLSGTWRYMNGTVTVNSGDCEASIGLLYVRVS